MVEKHYYSCWLRWQFSPPREPQKASRPRYAWPFSLPHLVFYLFCFLFPLHIPPQSSPPVPPAIKLDVLWPRGFWAKGRWQVGKRRQGKSWRHAIRGNGEQPEKGLFPLHPPPFLFLLPTGELKKAGRTCQSGCTGAADGTDPPPVSSCEDEAARDASWPAGDFWGEAADWRRGMQKGPKLQQWRKSELSLLVFGKQRWVLFWRGWWAENISNGEKPRLAATGGGRDALGNPEHLVCAGGEVRGRSKIRREEKSGPVQRWVCLCYCLLTYQKLPFPF